MPLLIVLLLLLSPDPAGAETLHVSLAAAPEAAGRLPDIPALQAGVQRLFAEELGILATLSFDDEQAAAAELSARVLLEAAGTTITVSTDLARARATRSLQSTVPAASPASLLATITGDLAFLYVASRGFDTLPLSPPPALVATLATDTLGALTGWNPEELEPVGLAASGDEVTICFPHRYLTLGPLFRISAATIRDINAQSVGREPLQLSGAIRATGGRIILLSEHEARFAVIDTRLGTRTIGVAPGLSGLPARLFGETTVAALPGKMGDAGVMLYPIEGGAPRVVRAAASYVPAFDTDGEGNLWTWDAGERRLRILTSAGQEVFSIRPLLSASTMPLPQQLAVFDDGSFLLAGSAQVWKFQPSGIPVWRLARIPGRPGERLPSSFDLAVNGSDGAFTILDAQSRRLLSFSASPSPAAGRLAGLIGRLDPRRTAELQDLSETARADGLSLMALQFGDQLARGGGTEGQRAAARIQLLREKAAGYAQLADDLTRDLLYERADGAWLRAAETLRQLAAESPDDEQAAGALQAVLARRREVREALSGPTEIQQGSARVLLGYADGCETTVALEITVRNSGSQAVRNVRMHAGLPTIVETPALVEIGDILPSQERAARIPMGSAGGGQIRLPASPVPVFVLVTYERGQEGKTRSFSFPAKAMQEGPPANLADALACAAVPFDALAASLAESLLSGPPPDSPAPLADLAGILDALGAARRGTTTRAGTPGTPAGTPPAPAAPAESKPGMRSLLRMLSPGESDWSIVTASIASSLGLRTAVVSVGDRAFALVDTGVPFFDALAAIPGLARFQRTLAAMSPAGTLWLPLSGRVPEAGGDSASWAAADALAALAGQGTAVMRRAEVGSSPGRTGSPIPFPLVLPGDTTRRSVTSLQEAMESRLAATRLP